MKMNTKKNEKRDLFDIRTGKELVVALLVTGGLVTILGTAPWLLAGALAITPMLKDNTRNRKRVSHAFWYAKKKGYVSHAQTGDRMRVALTEKGMRVARMNLLKIKTRRLRDKRMWDKKWRLILFDVSVNERVKRDALRQLIKRLGATKLQQSVWLYPHDCSEEINLLRNFFGFGDEQVRLIVSENIGNDRKYRRHFRI